MDKAEIISAALPISNNSNVKKALRSIGAGRYMEAAEAFYAAETQYAARADHRFENLAYTLATNTEELS